MPDHFVGARGLDRRDEHGARQTDQQIERHQRRQVAQAGQRSPERDHEQAAGNAPGARNAVDQRCRHDPGRQRRHPAQPT